MRYKLGPDIIVKTENAAKPHSQASGFLTALLSALPRVSVALDYGCGKLRYTDALLNSADTLIAVDSEVQLSRTQTIRGERTSIREVVRSSNRVTAYNIAEFEEAQMQFDRAFCINVLSVIPIYAARRRVFDTIRSHLKPGASCLFVVQYRNSDFTRMAAMPNARPWRDGYLINSLRGYSFYGLISPDALAATVRTAGLAVDEVRLNEGSVYLWGRV